MRLFNIAILCFLLFYGCSNDNHSNINSAKLNEIDKLIKSFIDNNQIPGAVVLVGNNEKIIYEKAFGLKNPLTNEKYNTDDIFRIASMTKAITSLGVIKLWEKGKIGLAVNEITGIKTINLNNLKESSNFDGMPTNIYDDGNIKTFFPHMESFQDRLSEYLV